MHDANGIPLKVGDKVLIPAVITQVAPEDDYCNVHLETTLGRRPDGAKEHIGGINTAVLISVGKLLKE